MLFEKYHMRFMKLQAVETLGSVWRIPMLFRASKKTLDMIEQECYIRYQGKLDIL